MRALALLLVLAACGPDGSLAWDGAGTVVNAGYEPARDWTTTSYDCFSRDKYGACTLSIPVDHHHHEDAHYWVYVQAEDVPAIHTVEVDQVTYQRCSQGKRFSAGHCLG